MSSGFYGTHLAAFFCLLLVRGALGVKYLGRMVGDPYDCPGKEDATMRQFFDSSRMVVDWNEEGTMRLNGVTAFIVQLDPKKPIDLTVSFRKKVNGRFISTGLSLHRKTLCPTFFDPTEHWFVIIDHLKGNQTLCPPIKGTEYQFVNKSFDMTLDGFPPSMDGIYEMTIDLFSEEAKLCVIILTDFYRTK